MDARDRVFGLVDGYIADPVSGESAIRDARAALAPEVLADLDSVLADRRISYRDGVLIQLGYGMVDPALDLPLRPEGARGNVAEFDRLLLWATGAVMPEREAALRLACAAVAATARPVLPMPDLNRSALTFTRTTGLLLDLLSVPSGGAYEQFGFAALLHTLGNPPRS
ncbi:MAG: hypothetical protein NXH82_01590 [Rhodobacteraceae bacterium]|nr:hypothetical protein [Paracoccaceae bacterium]